MFDLVCFMFHHFQGCHTILAKKERGMLTTAASLAVAAAVLEVNSACHISAYCSGSRTGAITGVQYAYNFALNDGVDVLVV